MTISRSRFEFALNQTKPSDWERFERLSSAFLAADYPNLRTTASSAGDGGRDAELVLVDGAPNVAAQYSVRVDWDNKIKETVRRIKETLPGVSVLIYMSNAIIGAKGDAIRTDMAKEGVFVDIRDQNFFLERFATDTARKDASTEFSIAIGDPIISELTQGGSPTDVALNSSDARTALLFLEMQTRDRVSQKELTKSAYESLVRAALAGSTRETRVEEGDIIKRVVEMMSSHDPAPVANFVRAALSRLASKGAVSRWGKESAYHLSHREVLKTQDTTASIQNLNDRVNVDIEVSLRNAGVVNSDELATLTQSVRNVLSHYLLRSGEAFARAVARGKEYPVEAASISSIALEVSPAGRVARGPPYAKVVDIATSSMLANPSPSTAEYVGLLSQSYTMFAFLSETPDIQRVTNRLFSKGEFWLDTSALLPVLAEEHLPDEARPFTTMFKQATAVGASLIVPTGVLNEIDSHLNLCVQYVRSSSWIGRVPYVVAQYILSGGQAGTFPAWSERFRGHLRSEDDIADFLRSRLKVRVQPPLPQDKLDVSVVAEVREYWQDVNARRRREGSGHFNLTSAILADHDSESYLSVLESRRLQTGNSPLGFNSWWLTLDRAAPVLLNRLNNEVRTKVRFSPVMSIDFLIKYLAFGPRRDYVGDGGRHLVPLLSGSLLTSLPSDLVQVASELRDSHRHLDEGVLRRRVRDELDVQRSIAGTVQEGGLDQIGQGLEGFFT